MTEFASDHSRDADDLLLALYASHFNLPCPEDELPWIAELLATTAEDQARALAELVDCARVERQTNLGTLQLTPEGVAAVLEMVECGLPDLVLAWRDSQEQAEALVIRRIAERSPDRAGGEAATSSAQLA